MNQTANNLKKTDTIRKIIPPDPKSEHYRECLYCKDPFTANHQLRRFCTSKNGIPNYCKHRYKVLVQGARIAGENVVVDHKHDLPSPPAFIHPPLDAINGLVIPKSKEEFEALSPAIPNPEILSKNNQILSDLLTEGKPQSFSLKTIIDLGIDLRVYKQRKQLPNSELSYIEIGIFAIFWTHKNELLITPITEILWM